MNIDNFEILTKRLKQIRTEKGMTQKDFAQEMGITPVTLSAYENNLKKPSLDLILKVAKKYEISLDWLCGLSDTKSKQNNQEYKTYSDVLKTLIKISDVVPYVIDDMANRKIEAGNGEIITIQDIGIFFIEAIFEGYLLDLARFRNLLDNETIDDSIYIACIEKLLRDANVPIKKEQSDNKD